MNVQCFCFPGDDGDDADVQRRHPVGRLDRVEHEDLHRGQDENAAAGDHDLEAEEVRVAVLSPRLA